MKLGQSLASISLAEVNKKSRFTFTDTKGEIFDIFYNPDDQKWVMKEWRQGSAIYPFPTDKVPIIETGKPIVYAAGAYTTGFITTIIITG